jgi:hypothetical protein
VNECAAPLSLASVVDYWLGDDPGAGDLEEHVMACATCSARVARLAAIAESVRRLVQRGAVPLVLTPDLLARLEEGGVRIRHHRVEPGGRTACTVGPDDDLVSLCLAGDFRAGERIDVVMGDAPVVDKRLEDVPVDRERGQVILVEPGAAIRPLPAHRATIRVLGVGDEGERIIGEYALEHQPWPGRRG